MAAATRRPGLTARRRSDPRSSGRIASRSLNAEDHQEDGRPPETHTQPLTATVADPTVSGTGWRHCGRSSR